MQDTLSPPSVPPRASRLKGTLASAAAAFPLNFADVLVLIGATGVLVGVFLLWGVPAMLIVGGLAVLWVGSRLYVPPEPRP